MINIVSIITTSNHTHLSDRVRYLSSACGRRFGPPHSRTGALTPMRGQVGTANSREAVTCRACRRSSAFHLADPARIELETSHADAMLTIESLRSYLRNSAPSERESIARMMPGAQYVIDLDARLEAEVVARRRAEAETAGHIGDRVEITSGRLAGTRGLVIAHADGDARTVRLDHNAQTVVVPLCDLIAAPGRSGWQHVSAVSSDSISEWIHQAFGNRPARVLQNGRGISFPTISVASEYRLVDPWA